MQCFQHLRLTTLAFLEMIGCVDPSTAGLQQVLAWLHAILACYVQRIGSICISLSQKICGFLSVVCFDYLLAKLWCPAPGSSIIAFLLVGIETQSVWETSCKPVHVGTCDCPRAMADPTGGLETQTFWMKDEPPFRLSFESYQLAVDVLCLEVDVAAF